MLPENDPSPLRAFVGIHGGDTFTEHLGVTFSLAIDTLYWAIVVFIRSVSVSIFPSRRTAIVSCFARFLSIIASIRSTVLLRAC